MDPSEDLILEMFGGETVMMMMVKGGRGWRNQERGGSSERLNSVPLMFSSLTLAQTSKNSQ